MLDQLIHHVHILEMSDDNYRVEPMDSGERKISGGVVGKSGASFGNLLTWLNFINCESCSVA